MQINDTLQTLLKRCSVRNYLPQMIEPDKIQKLKQVINNAPTSMNIQSFSAVFITNKAIKHQMMLWNWQQSHIDQAPLLVIFFADVNRLIAAQQMHHLPDTTHQWDQYITGTIDATIACTQAMDAAINMGLGTCFIGGLRRFASQINQTLNVNGTAIPVVAMTFGHSTEPGTHRPKVNKCYDELYNNELLIKELHEYDEQSKIYYDQVYKKNISWSLASAKAVQKMDSQSTLTELKKIWEIQ